MAGMGAAAFVTSVVAIIGLGMLHGALQSVGVFVQAGVLAGAVVVLLWPYSGHALRRLWVAARCRLQARRPRAPNLGKKQGPLCYPPLSVFVSHCVCLKASQWLIFL